MQAVLITPANATILGIPMPIFSVLIPAAGIVVLAYILLKRLQPLVKAQPDPRTDQIPRRLLDMYTYPHHRMPRYWLSSAIHITTLVSLIVLSLHVISLVLSGISDLFRFAGLSQSLLGNLYCFL